MYAVFDVNNRLVGTFRRIRSAKNAGEKTRDYYRCEWVKDMAKLMLNAIMSPRSPKLKKI